MANEKHTLLRVPAADASWTFADDAYGSTVAPSSNEPAPPPIDDQFASRYVTQTTLGEGGMGVVRLVTDRRIGREVAMKTMRTGREPNAGLVSRFLREACVQGQLEHPAIVPVYDVGADPSRTPYFTMKRVHGATFEEIFARLRRRDPDAVEAYGRRKLLSAFASVCQAVDLAHARGVVHRDLKPGNVMVGAYGEVYVLDWGVAKVLGVKDEPHVSVTPPAGIDARTIAGIAMGTPGYMAPEQARGDKDIDARADVYALGAILFELLALEPLHRGATVPALLASTQMPVDARPSARNPEANVPPELDAICVQATAPERAERFASVREMVLRIERYLDGDRDLARRRQLADEHAASASAEAERSIARVADATEARRRALREVGRALALDPENAKAMATVMRLLTAPPDELPPEAMADLKAAAQTTQRATARGALFGYLAWFLFVPFGFWMGVRSPTAVMWSAVLWALAAASAYLALRRAGVSHGLRVLAVVATAAAASITCAVCGPYVLVPTLAVINVMLWLLVSDRGWRPLIIGLGALTVMAPAALDWTRIVHFYNFRDGHVTILQGMLVFHPIATHALLLAASLALVAITAILISRFRDNLDDAEHRLHLQAWQLKQLASFGTPTAQTPGARR